ncbi:hypothetical protein [Microbacterium sp. AR7-10]|uniref:hypothetical protein n=1 Tax=Microbacterium sp. AR7-10 TaxID=1891970 RepID=UPI0008FCA7A2|nr:hypothetical protein [Microbacterium sp. AR7-10]OIU88667.1 hypothetical protein BFN01_04280 [Microbacterium sp. AR7-10]
MKKSGIAAIATAAVLVIGGGAAYALSTNGQAAEGPAVIAATATTTPTPDATESAAPLVAETSAPPTAAENAEDAFLIEARSRLAKIRTQIPDATDAQLLDAAHEACERIEGGESSAEMSLIDGETKSDAGYFMDSGAIITSARLTMCPPTE